MANNRERLLFLLKTLMDNTDATHDLTLKDLEAIYKENGISGTPKTIRADFQTLEEMGFHVVASPNAGKATVYSYEQTFEGPELKMIIDAVSAAKFISPGNTQMLIRKLLGLTSRTAADEILQNLDPTDHHESPNRKLFDTIQVITRARDLKKKISYQYYDYNLQKKLILHNNGEVYTYSPYDFAWNEDRYYLLGCVDKRPGIINPVRMDLLTNVKILDEDAVPAPPGFSPGKYSDTVFTMFGGEETEVILEAENTLVKKFIDRFGDSFSIRKASSTTFFATVRVSISPTFFSWVFQYNGRIRIVEPEIVTQEYAGMLGRLLRYYQNFGLGIPEGQEPR